MFSLKTLTLELLAIAASLLLCLQEVAGQYVVKSREFSVADGVPGSVVRGVTVSDDGVLWLTGRSGLAFYDGYGFNRVGYGGTEANNLTTVKSVGKEGVLAVATNYRAVYYDICKDEFRYIQPEGDVAECRNFYITGGDKIWVTANDMLYSTTSEELHGGALLKPFVYRGEVNVHNYNKVKADSRGCEWIFTDVGVVSAADGALLSGKQYEYLLEIDDKQLFVSYSGEIGEYDKSNGIIVGKGYSPMADIMRAEPICVDGKLYAVGGMHLWLLDLYQNKAHWEAMADGTFHSLSLDSRGRLWALGEAKDVVLVEKDGTVRRIDVDDQQGGISPTRMPIWMEDAEGVIWVAPRDGRLSYYDEASGRMVSPSQPKVDVTYWRNGIDGSSIWATGSLGIVELRPVHTRMHAVSTPTMSDVRSVLFMSDGTICAGNMDGHVVRLSMDGKVISDIRISKYGVYCLAEDKAHHRLLAGTKGDGLWSISRDGRAERIDAGLGKNIYDIAVRDDGSVGVAMLDSGFCILRENGRHTHFSKCVFPGRRVEMVDGKWLVCTKEGFFLAEDNGNIHHIGMRGRKMSDILQAEIVGDSVTCVVEGGPVMRVSLNDILEGEEELDYRIIIERGTFGEQVQALATDRTGKTWLVGETKVGIFSEEISAGVFSPQDLQMKLQFTEARPTVLGDRIAIGCRGNILFLHTDEMRISSFEPKPMLTELTTGDMMNGAVLLGQDTIVLPPNIRNFSLSFTALDPAGQEFVEYSYCLNKENDEPTCMKSGTTHHATLLSLGAGAHVFRVNCTNADGRWSSKEAKLTIIARPHFYEKTSFKVVMCLLVLAAIIAVVRIIWLQAKKKRMAAETERRLEFLTDISHRLRTPLTLIGGPLGQLLEREELSPTGRTYLQFAYDSSQQMIDLLDSRMYEEEDYEHGVTSQAVSSSDNTDGRKSDDDISVSEDADGRLRILIVEDNESLRYFLQTSLSPEYVTLVAHNGQEGLDIARKESPDFIITDISMPVMDGMQMVKEIKSDNNLSHIPIVILSAKTDLNHRIAGLEAGVDDYITKPFSVAYLKSRVDNIVRQRAALQSRISYAMAHPGDKGQGKLPQVSKSDQQFVADLTDFIEKNLANADIRIEDLSSAMNLGRTVFFSKVKSITGMSPVDLLRHIRLSRAADKLAHGNDSISEVAYSVGFNDPKYFARIFKEFAGMTPTDYRRAKTGGTVE